MYSTVFIFSVRLLTKQVDCQQEFLNKNKKKNGRRRKKNAETYSRTFAGSGY